MRTRASSCAPAAVRDLLTPRASPGEFASQCRTVGAGAAARLPAVAHSLPKQMLLCAFAGGSCRVWGAPRRRSAASVVRRSLPGKRCVRLVRRAAGPRRGMSFPTPCSPAGVCPPPPQAYEALPQAIPIMTVIYNGTVHQIAAEPTPEGEQHFLQQIRCVSSRLAEEACSSGQILLASLLLTQHAAALTKCPLPSHPHAGASSA